MSTSAQPRIPTLDGLVRYQVLARWARGGMADVHVARQVGKMGFDRLVAIKVLRADFVHDQALREMFMQEARTAVLLNHPRIIQTYDAGESGDDLYLVMEFVRGATLRHVMQKLAKAGEVFSTAFVLELVYQVGLALDYAHQLKDLQGNELHLVHRDVAPSNIMLTQEGGTKLLDFGIAKVTAPRHISDAGTVKGKFAYMSPEQVQGLPLDGRSDVYALGLVLWELLTGRPALVGARDVDVIRAAQHPDIPAPSTVGGPDLEGLDDLVLRAIAPAVEARIGTARELAEEANRLRVRLFPSFNMSAYIREVLGRYSAVRQAKLEELLASVADAPDPEAVVPITLDVDSSSQMRPLRGSSAPPPAPEPPKLLTRPLSAPPPVPVPKSRSKTVARTAVALLLLGCAAVGAWLFFAQGASVERRVVVTSEPPGASVSANGRLLGRTPLDVAVRRGTPLALTFSRPGFEEASRIVRADDARGVSVHLERSHASGSVSVRTTPAGAQVTVDGVERPGQTPLILEGLWRGESHRVAVRLPGYEPQARSVDLTQSGSLDIELVLVPLAAAIAPNLAVEAADVGPRAAAWAAPRSRASGASSRVTETVPHPTPVAAAVDDVELPPSLPAALAPRPSPPVTPPSLPPSAHVIAPAASALVPPRAPTRAAPSVRMGLPRVSGVVDRSAVRRSLDGLLPQLRACLLSPTPVPAGTVQLRFVLDDAGRARNVAVVGAPTASSACLERALRGAAFPGSTASDAAIQVSLDVQRP